MNFPGLVGPSYPSSSVTADSERTVNLYPERVESPGAKPAFPYVLLPTPGFESFLGAGFPVLPTAPVRGLFAANGRAWAISGDTLYELYEDGSYIAIGTVQPGGLVSFAVNGEAGNQLFLTSGHEGYLVNLTTNVMTIELGYPQATQVVYLDGYFVVLDVSNQVFRVSNLLDGSAFPALQGRIAGSDYWKSLAVSHKLLWLMGEQTSEVWYDAGTDASQPFAPDASGFLQYGIGAAATLVELDNAPTWLGRTKDGDRVVLRANGYQPQRISTHALEHAMMGYTRVDDAFSFSYQEQGHSFYMVTFPTPRVTWGFDSATNLWHERGFWNAVQGRFDAWRPSCHCFAFGKHLVGDSQSGKIFVMSSLTTNTTTEDPEVMLRWSNNAGKTWSNEHWTGAGSEGNYDTRVIWQRLGRARKRVFELSLTDPVLLDMDGNGIRRLRRCPDMSTGQKWVFYNALELVLDAGDPSGAAKWVGAYVDATEGTN